MADMNLYAGSPFETPYERLQRRRAIMQALQEKAMQQHQNETVSGRVVPFSPLEGLTQLATAYTAGQGQNQLDQQQAQLQQGYQANEADAARQIIDTMLGRGNTSPEGPVQPIAASPDKAALMATTSPYLRNNPALQKVIAAKIATQGTDKQFYTYQIDANGNIVRLPARPGENPSLATMNGTPIEAAKYAYGPNYQAANARQTGQNVSDLTYQPPIAGGKVQAEQNAQMGAPGASKADVSASVAAGEKRALNTIAREKGSPEYLKNQRLHAEDYNALATTRLKTTQAMHKLNRILDPKNKEAFNMNFGGYTALGTQYAPGKTQDMRAWIDSIKSDLKTAGLEMIRSGGSIGQMTEREWPIVQDMIDKITPVMGEPAAREAFNNIKTYLMGIQKKAEGLYLDQWQGTPFMKDESSDSKSTGNATAERVVDW